MIFSEESSMKKWKSVGLVLALMLGLVLVGCSNPKATTKVATVDYSKLSSTDANKVKLSGDLVADFDENPANDSSASKLLVYSHFNLKLENDTKKNVTFDLSKFTIVDSNSKPTKSTTIKLAPGQVHHVTKLFTKVTSTPSTTNKVELAYPTTKDVVFSIAAYKNQKDFDTWLKKNNQADTPTTQSSSQTSQSSSTSTTTSNKTTPNANQTQVIAWFGRELARQSKGKFNEDDYLYRTYKNDQGIVMYEVSENHNSPNMKAAGADPNTQPVIATIFVNANGQLENLVTHEVYDMTK